jgi:hypothetical protein
MAPFKMVPTSEVPSAMQVAKPPGVIVKTLGFSDHQVPTLARPTLEPSE